MNRENYIALRVSNNIGPVAFDYFNNNSEERMDKDIFSKAFPIFVMRNMSSINWNLLWALYDSIFKVNFLLDKNDNIIKVI